jgi:hypothetical protein
MTRQGIVGSRSAATLAHALPNVRLRIHEGDRVLLEVAHPPLAPGPWPVTTACAFHAAVAEAYLGIEAGRRLVYLSSSSGRATPGRALAENLLAAFAATELVEDAVGCTGRPP